MSIGVGGTSANPFSVFRLENLHDLVTDEAERLEIQHGGLGKQSLKMQLKQLQADMRALINACNGSESAGLEVLDASEGKQQEFCIRAEYYDFFFVLPDPAATWFVLAYLERN